MTKQTSPQPMTLNELRETDAPVWRVVNNNSGYWCLCNNGRIVNPKGTCFDASEVPTVTFLRSKPEVK